MQAEPSTVAEANVNAINESAAPSLERWLPISGFSDYEVSDQGRVKRVTPGRQGRLTGRALKPWQVRGGYLYVGLTDADGRRHKVPVNRLVLQNFIGAPPDGRPEGAHWDGNPRNNCLTNLRWASRLENAADRDRHGTTARGEANAGAKLTEDEVHSIRYLLSLGFSQQNVADRYGVHSTQICHIATGKSWRSLPLRAHS